MSGYSTIQERIDQFLLSPPTPTQTYVIGNSPFLEGCDLSELSHSELQQLLVSLTLTLSREITDDIYRVWAWCGAAMWSLHHQSPLAHSNGYWLNEYLMLLHLLLARIRDPSAALTRGRAPFQEVNRHAVVIAFPGNTETIAGPLIFALIEGALRRLSGGVLSVDGTIVGPVPASLPTKKVGQRVNRIEEAFLIYQEAQKANPTASAALANMVDALTQVFSAFDPAFNGNAIDLIGTWRNSALHGHEFWRQRVPVLATFLCFMATDSIGESWYNGKREKLRSDAYGFSETGRGEDPNRLNLYPPDLFMIL